MSQMNMIRAINSALDIMLGKDPTVIILGEDVGYFGGVFRCTEGLQVKYGEHRVIDAPIAEGGIIGSAIGIGVNGLRPVAEIQFADYIYPGLDQVISELARLRYRSGGEFFSPVTIRTPCGGGIRGGQTHSQSPEALFTHLSGVNTVMPSNPYDAKGLLISAIESDDPVVYFEPKRLYNGPFDGDPDKPAMTWSKHPGGEVPEDYYAIPLGQAALVEQGNDLSIITYGTMVHVAPGRRQTGRRQCRHYRCAFTRSTGCCHTQKVGGENRSLPDRTRGLEIQWLRRGTGCHRAGRVLLPPGSTDRACCRLGNTLPTRL